MTKIVPSVESHAIARLRASGRSLALQLEEAAGDVRSGIPLSAELLADIDRFRHATRAIASALGLQVDARFDEMQSAFDRRSQADESARRHGFTVSLRQLAAVAPGYADALEHFRARLIDEERPISVAALDRLTTLLSSDSEAPIDELMSLCADETLPLALAMGIHTGQIIIEEPDLDETEEPESAPDLRDEPESAPDLKDEPESEPEPALAPEHALNPADERESEPEDPEPEETEDAEPDDDAEPESEDDAEPESEDDAEPESEDDAEPESEDDAEPEPEEEAYGTSTSIVTGDDAPLLSNPQQEPECTVAESADREQARRDLATAVSRALGARRPDIAYWAARAAEIQGDVAPVSSSALEAAVLAPYARSGEPTVNAALDDALSRTLELDELSLATVLVACAGGLLGAVVSPYGPAPIVLKTHSRRLGAGLSDLGALLGERAPRGELQIAARRDAAAELDRRVVELVDKAQQSRVRLKEVTTSYVPARRVWLNILDGPLALVFTAAAGTADLSELRRLMAQLADPREIERLIDDQHYSRRRAAREGLTSRARDWLRGHINEVIALGTATLDIRSALEQREHGGTSSDEWVRDRVRALTGDITASLKELSHNRDESVVGGAELLASSWGTFRALVVEGEVRASAWVPDDRAQLLALGLAAAPDLRIDGRYTTDLNHDGLAGKLLTAVDLSPDFAEVVRVRADAGEFHVAELLLDSALSGSESLRTEVNAKRDRMRAETRARATSMSHSLTKAARDQAIADEDHRTLAAELQILDFDAGDLRGQRLILDRVSGAIESGQRSRCNDIRLELEELDVDSSLVNEVERLLTDGQIALATDRVARLRVGDRVAAPTASAPTLTRFLAFIDPAPEPKTLARRVRDRDPAAAQAIQLLNGASASNKRVKSDTVSQIVRSVLGAAGFGGVLAGASGNVRDRVDVVSFDLADVTSAPVPAFGSGLRQAVAVVVNNRPSDDLLDILADRQVVRGGSTPFLILLNPLKRAARADLAAAARSANRTFLLLDAYVIAFAALTDGARLATTFSASLPYTWSNPYVTHGVVPSEMFFGRVEEFDTLVDPARSAFIFGGRQLGKSALLGRAVAQTHDPAHHRITILIDLESKRVGHSGRTDVIWGHIAGELERAAGESIGGTRADVIAWIREWLDAHPTGELRVLLDETDRFLEMDSRPDEHRQPLANVAAFRELMMQSGGRFKVVFAGLHSVQRFLGLPNQPLAHLGAPTPIGPLSWGDARDLVEQPMQALGLEFDEYVVDRMLTLSGRHPSLLQHLCRAMVDHMRRKRGASVPARVTNSDLDTVYEDKGLRQELRRRFDWTLDLDQRYRALAYLLAWRSLDDADVRRNGLSVSELHDDVAELWPETFGEMQQDVLRTLCDEMVSLLVFAVHDGRYRLWSTNVLQLLGSQDEIEEGLSSTSPSRSASIYEPQAYRRAQGPTALARSPLTFGDERALLADGGPGVHLVLGSALCGVDRVIDSLRECAASPDWAPELSLIVHRKVPPANELQHEQDGRVVHVAPVVTGKSLDWFLGRLAELRDVVVDTGVSAALVLDTSTISWWPDLAEKLTMGELGDGIALLPLKRWDRRALRVWLDEAQLPSANDEERDRVFDVTGGWPAFVEDFGALAIEHNRDLARSLTAAQSRPPDPRRATELLGIAGDAVLARCAHELASFTEGGGGTVADLAAFADIDIDSALRARDTFELLDALGGGRGTLELEQALTRQLAG